MSTTIQMQGRGRTEYFQILGLLEKKIEAHKHKCTYVSEGQSDKILGILQKMIVLIQVGFPGFCG